jgi:hypothetical protein
LLFLKKMSHGYPRPTAWCAASAGIIGLAHPYF